MAPTIITTIQTHFESSNLRFFLLQMYIFVSQIIGNEANTNKLLFQKTDLKSVLIRNCTMNVRFSPYG